MKKFSLLLVAHIVLSGLFVLFSISFAFDISFFAFIFSGAFIGALVFFYHKSFVPTLSIRTLKIVHKMLEYHPFVLLIAFILRRAGEKGTSLWLDVICIALWVLSTLLSVFLLHILNHKRIKKLFLTNHLLGIDTCTEYKKVFADYESAIPLKARGLKWLIFEILEWVDAFVQAAFLVSLINIFIFQLYEIPSESMVSEFLIGDRVIVFKTPSGPAFPLSKIALPRMRTYNRGDIVVFRNPHYSKDRKSDIQTFVSQLIYMLTFTTVNLNVDEFGMPKYDPLVKRITGLPGEQLMMVDGILYSRTKNSPEFAPVHDAWADWNLNTLPSDIKKSIASFPLSNEIFNAMQSAEQYRAQTAIIDVKSELETIVADFRRIKTTYTSSGARNVANPFHESVTINRLFAQHDETTRKLLNATQGDQWLADFLTSWVSEKTILSDKNALVGGDLYQDTLFRYNILAKLAFARLLVYNAELLEKGVSATEMLRDEKRRTLLNNASNIDIAVLLLNSRAMPVFPANTQDGNAAYIPDHAFFMMGDNRFNSLDMRHSYEEKILPLTMYDPASFVFASNVSPQSVESKYILGTTLFRFWPLTRIGLPHSGKQR